MKTQDKNNKPTKVSKKQLYNDRTGNEKAYNNKSDYAEDYDTTEEVKEPEDNWNNEGGTITTRDKDFEKPLISYDNSKDQKKLFKKSEENKVKVSKLDNLKAETEKKK